MVADIWGIYRWLKREDAAQFVGMTIPQFTRHVKEGNLPPPSDALGPRNPRWDRDGLYAVMRDILLLTLVGKPGDERPTLAETELGRRQAAFEARKRVGRDRAE